MLWVGLTGGIASGKSTVSNILREMGIPVIDADAIAHQALRHNRDKIVASFGPDIVGSDGEIDRRLLGAKVFADANSKRILESLVHPYVRTIVEERKKQLEASGEPLAVYDVPLLFESGLQSDFDHILLVYVPEAVSIRRLMARNGWTEAEARLRIKNQMDIEKKKAEADSILDNQGDIEYLRQQVERWKKLIEK